MLHNLQKFSPLFSKTAEQNEEDLSLSDLLELEGAKFGLNGGLILGGAQHILNSKKPENLERFSLIGKTPGGKGKALAQRALDAGIRMGTQGAIGAGTGYAIGGGIGAALKAYGREGDEARSQVEEEKREYLRQKIEEMRMDKEANDQLATRLAKTAGLLDGIRRVTGRDYKKATQAYNDLNSMEGFSSMGPNEYFPKLEEAELKMEAEKLLRDQAQEKALPYAIGGTIGAGTLGYGLAQDHRMNNRIMDELMQEEQSGEGVDSQKRQGAGSVSNAPAGVDKTASQSPLFRPLEKNAGPLNFIKNFTGSNLRKAQNRFDEIRNVPRDPQKRFDYTREAKKDVRNARADRNRAQLGGGLALGAAGAGIGGYNAYQNSKNPEEDNTMNQFTNDEQKVAYESMMGRLEKTAGPRDFVQNMATRGGDALASARNLGQNALSGARDFGNTALGKDYRAVRDLGDDQQLMDQALIGQARNDMLKAQGLAGAGLVGAGGAGYAVANAGGDDDEEQVAFNELMDRLEKTAAPGGRLFSKAKGSASAAARRARDTANNTKDRISGAASNAKDRISGAASNAKDRVSGAASSAKNSVSSTANKAKQGLQGYSNTVLGKNYRAVNNMGDKNQLMDNALIGKARNDMLKAQGATAAGLAGAGGLGYAAARGSNKDREKEASEVLNGLYKEAASAIVDESLPPVRQHVDPMDRITFNK